MVETLYNQPVHNIVLSGKPSAILDGRCGAGIFPGMALMGGATDYDVSLEDGSKPFLGFAGFEDVNMRQRPADINTAYDLNAICQVLCGSGFNIWGQMAAGFKGALGDKLATFKGGMLAPIEMIDGTPAIKIPFAQSTVEKDTGVQLPAGFEVKDVRIRVTSNVAGSSISVGIKSTEAGGNATGFLSGESCVNAGLVGHVADSQTLGNITLGAFLMDAVKSADATAIYSAVRKRKITDGTAKTLTYTTSNHAVAGYILVLLNAPGVTKVGSLLASVDATAGAVGCPVKVGE